MRKKADVVVETPFPAWDGVFQIAAVCEELRREKMFGGIPDCHTPRRISIWEKGKKEGFDDVKIIEYWHTRGFTVTATLGGREDEAYGTSWTLIGLRLQWQDHGHLGLPAGEEKLSVRLSAEQVEAIALAAYLHTHTPPIGASDVDKAVRRFVAAEAASNAIIAELAAPIRATWERQQSWMKKVETVGFTLR